MKEQSGGGYRTFGTTPKPRNIRESFEQYHEQTAEEFLREDAKARGMEWHVYCKKFGIEGDAAKKRHKKHQVKFNPGAEGTGRRKGLPARDLMTEVE